MGGCYPVAVSRARFVAEVTAEGALDRWDPEASPRPIAGPAPEVGAWVEVTIDGGVDGGVARPVGPPIAPAGSALGPLLAIAAAEGLDPVFPASVEAEVAALLSLADGSAPDAPPPGTDDPSLVDLTDRPFVTIDNEDSRDLDQALLVEPDGDGHRVRYALADASFYVRPGSALFAEAMQRSASFYFPGWMVPMLPRALSEGIVSLNPHVDRRALVFDMRLDAAGRCTRTEIVRARIRSRAKLSYAGVQRFLDDPAAHPVEDAAVVACLHALAEVGRRRIDEASNRDVVHHRRRAVEVGLEGRRSFVIYGGMRNDVERYNEQISLLCNVEGARLLLAGEADPHVHAVYRVHPSPPDDRVEAFAAMVDRLAALRDDDGMRWRRAEGESLSQYLRRLPTEGDAGRVAQAIHRQAILMNVRSTFTDAPAEHHGVGAEVYARFSSPMREVVGVFLHKELLERLGLAASAGPPAEDAALREQVIEAANRAKRVQRKITALSNRLAIDALLAKDLARPELERPARRGTVMGLTHGKLHLALDDPPIDLKLYRRDLERARGEEVRLGDDDVTWRDADGSVVTRVGDPIRVRVSHRDADRDRWVLSLLPA